MQFHRQSPPVPQFGVEPPVFKVLFTIMARPFGENPPDLSGLPDPEPDNAFEVEMPGMALNLKYDGQPENLLGRWMWTLESYVFVTFNWDWFNASDLSKFNVYCKVRTYAEGQALGPVRLLKTPGAPDPS